MKDIIVLCDGSRVDELTTTFNLQFEGEENRGVLWSATMHRYGLGVIAIECAEDTAAFLQTLEKESAIFDYSEGPEYPTFSVARADGGSPLV
jgi:hypothetical protein